MVYCTNNMFTVLFFNGLCTSNMFRVLQVVALWLYMSYKFCVIYLITKIYLSTNYKNIFYRGMYIMYKCILMYSDIFASGLLFTETIKKVSIKLLP